MAVKKKAAKKKIIKKKAAPKKVAPKKKAVKRLPCAIKIALATSRDEVETLRRIVNEYRAELEHQTAEAEELKAENLKLKTPGFVDSLKVIFSTVGVVTVVMYILRFFSVV